MIKYDVLGVVGEGAYGVVLKCKNKDTHEVVAIKKFKESEEDEAVRKTTLREVKILRMMRHENIVQLKEAFRRKSKLYLVFEFVEKSMLDILEAHPHGVDSETVRVLTCQLLRAIEHCHRHDVIHRDIKPENLLIDPKDSALRLCDFGFARTMNSDAPLTDYVATRWYRAPELLLCSTRYGKDVDLWAVGCIMGELTDGQPLFAGESEVDQLFVIQKVLGPLTPEHMEMFLRNPRFLGIQFPDVNRPETLEKRYVRRMSKMQMQLLKGVLAMEPKKRLPARDTLRMPWFDGLRLPRSLRPPSQSQSRARPESSSSIAQLSHQDRHSSMMTASRPAHQVPVNSHQQNPPHPVNSHLVNSHMVNSHPAVAYQDANVAYEASHDRSDQYRPHPYVLPWEGFAADGQGAFESNSFPEHAAEPSDKVYADGRRSRGGHRRHAADNSGGHAEWAADRQGGFGGQGRGIRVAGGIAVSNPAIGFATQLPCGPGQSGSNCGMSGPAFAADFAQWGNRGGGTVSAGHHHVASAGTGGSDDWPPTQGRLNRPAKDEYEDDKNSWVKEKRRSSRVQSNGLHGLPMSTARRSPEPGVSEQYWQPTPITNMGLPETGPECWWPSGDGHTDLASVGPGPLPSLRGLPAELFRRQT